MNNKVNRLVNSSSPYLRQHSNNPVDWYEWGNEALKKAKEENKPLLISIGYAACHWCHVMARESFMDEHIATIMNDKFICIKIDREERPDIDQIYMDAALLSSGNAGWPLNVFALPDGRPFFGSTYFPSSTWSMLISHIAEMYSNERPKLEEQANKLTHGIASNIPIKFKASEISNFSIDNYNKIFPSLEIMIDKEFGGFLSDQKFPLPIGWEAMLQYYYFMNKEKSANMIFNTLDNMLKGGIYDQLGGGFCRYTVDKYWKVPHFEKMLYDNGQLISLYSHAYQVSKKQEYAEIVENTILFVEKELSSSTNGFYSSINADSEGEEGKYYIWTKDEIKEILDEPIADIICEYYNISNNGNWEKGKNILLISKDKESFAKVKELTTAEFHRILLDANAQLLKHRNTRVRPSTDDKILTSWNAIMLSGYIDAYKSLGKQEYLSKAISSAKFLKENMIDSNNMVFRSYKDEKAIIPGFLDDYALLAQAFIQLYEVTLIEDWIITAKNIAEYAIDNFLDKSNGMFFYSSDKSNELIVRKYQIPDNVIPSSNSVMAEVLFRLSIYFDNKNYKSIALRMMAQVESHLVKGGPYYSNWARLFGLITHKPYEIAITGPESINILREIQKHYLPSCIFMGGESNEIPLLKDKQNSEKTMIYICQNKQCLAPVESVQEALKIIHKD